LLVLGEKERGQWLELDTRSLSALRPESGPEWWSFRNICCYLYLRRWSRVNKRVGGIAQVPKHKTPEQIKATQVILVRKQTQD
jgi:hypothetical protein